MSTGAAIAITLVFLAVDVMIVLAVRLGVAQVWRRLAAGHEPVEPGADAIRRRYQSFRVDFFNLGFGMHVAVDEERLHLAPSWVVRWVGITPVSVPWEEMEFVRRRWRWVRVRINGVRVDGPAWCLELALPPEEAGAHRR